MKFSAATLKNADYKKLAIDHAEKVVLGCVVLFVLMSLMSTSWSPFPKTPEELIEKSDTVKAAVLKNEWPETEAETYSTKEDLRKEVDGMLNPLEVTKFSWNAPFWYDLFPKDKPIREPKWLPVEDLIADAGRAPIVVNPAGGAPAPVAGPKNNAAAPPVGVPDRFKVKDGKKPAAGAPVGAAGLGGVVAPALGVQTQASGDTGRGVRFVAIRGPVPLRRQQELIAQAMNLSTTTNLSDLFEFFDFELQRKTAQPGNNPWGGPWQKVDIEVAYEVLQEAADFAVDELDAGVTDAVITMPFPRRSQGIWGKLATHPSVKNFILSPKEMERQNLINQKILEAARQLEESKPKDLEKRGFAPQQHDLGKMRRSVLLSDQGDDVMEEIASDLDPQGLQRGMVKQIEDRITAAGRLLLFRYLDFDVVPGNAYKYRVRLLVNNPNYGRGIEEVVSPDVVEGQTRKTPWSVETAPVVVPIDTDYFLTRVNLSKTTAPPKAQIKIYKWSTETGTVISDLLYSTIGQFVGGLAEKTRVLRPAEKKFDEENIDLTLNDLLIDMQGSPKINFADHPDLALPSRLRGKIGVTDRALAVNEFGELVPLDPVTRKAFRSRAELLLGYERRPFEDLKDKATVAAGDTGGTGDSLLDQIEDPAAVEPVEDPSATRRTRNPRRKKR